MKSARLLSMLAAASLIVTPMTAQAAPVERSSAHINEGSDLRGAHSLLLALIIVAVLAVALGGKGKNAPVST